LLVVVAACGGSGFETGAATLTSITPPVMSAASVSFTQADGAGTMVLGWTIRFYAQGAGADCKADDVKPIGSVGIFTAQQPDASHKKAMLQTGDIVIVTASPPTVSGTAAATMGVMDIANVVGTISITDFHLLPDLTADKISGTVNAGGTDKNGNGVSITGMFVAPVCE
jgi:hypothetical protein